MLAILLSASVCLFFFLVFGFFTAKVVKTPAIFVEKLFLGLVFLNTLSSLVSLFFPINSFILICVIGLSIIVFLFGVKNEILLHFTSSSKNKFGLFFSALFILLTYFLSVGPPRNYDTELYHIQSIKWIENYPIVPGLANLHGRFGFNPNIFTLFALTSFKDMFGQEIFVINFLVLSIMLYYLINKIFLTFRQNGISSMLLLYSIPLYSILYLGDLTSPSPDLLYTVIVIFIFLRFIELSDSIQRKTLKDFIPVLILGTYVLTVKLAALPILILFVFPLVKYKSDFKNLYILFPVFSIILIPWLIRNVVISSWLIYPFPALDLFNFEWKLPIEKVVFEKELITGWARSPGAGCFTAAKMQLSDWFPIWWDRQNESDKRSFIIGMLFPIITIISALIKRNNNSLAINVLSITALLGVVFWLLLAPDWRFGKPFLLMASLTPLYIIKDFKIKYIKNEFIVCIIPLYFFYQYINDYSINIEINYNEVLHSNSAITPKMIEISSDYKFKKYIRAGIYIYYPDNNQDRCFYHCLPCAPLYDSTITLRKEGVLSNGFKHIKP